MPDIFGREPQDYEVVRMMREEQTWDRYQQWHGERRPVAEPRHNFAGLGSGVPVEFSRAAEDGQSLGYLTNNMLAIQTMVDEIMYTAYRLPMFVYLNMMIPEGARSYGVRVMDRTGQAQRITAPGFEAPSATVAQTLVTQPIYPYGLDAEWSVSEIRSAMLAGIPLDTQTIEAAVTGTMETMEHQALLGGYGDQGLLNLPITGNDAVTQMAQATNMTFSDLTATAIRDLINGRISNIIEVSRETLGRNVNTGMTVYLPGMQYDLLTTRYIGDDADHTLMASIMRDNPWTHFTGNPLAIERVIELADQGAGTTDRMVVALKHETSGRNGRGGAAARVAGDGQGPGDLRAGGGGIFQPVRQAAEHDPVRGRHLMTTPEEILDVAEIPSDAGDMPLGDVPDPETAAAGIADFVGDAEFQIADAPARRKRKVRVGDTVMYRRATAADDWLPMMVTHVTDAATVSGVVMTAHPDRAGYRSAADGHSQFGVRH